MSKAVANPNDEDELTEEEDLALLGKLYFHILVSLMCDRPTYI